MVVFLSGSVSYDNDGSWSFFSLVLCPMIMMVHGSPSLVLCLIIVLSCLSFGVFFCVCLFVCLFLARVTG